MQRQSREANEAKRMYYYGDWVMFRVVHVFRILVGTRFGPQLTEEEASWFDDPHMAF